MQKSTSFPRRRHTLPDGPRQPRGACIGSALAANEFRDAKSGDHEQHGFLHAAEDTTIAYNDVGR